MCSVFAVPDTQSEYFVLCYLILDRKGIILGYALQESEDIDLVQSVLQESEDIDLVRGVLAATSHHDALERREELYSILARLRTTKVLLNM